MVRGLSFGRMGAILEWWNSTLNIWTVDYIRLHLNRESLRESEYCNAMRFKQWFNWWFFKQWFINGLKEEIESQVEMNHPATPRWRPLNSLFCAQVVSYAQCKHPNLGPWPNLIVVAPKWISPPLKFHNLTRAKMEECQLNGLYYNYDENYSLGQKCKEHKLSMAIFENIYDDEFDGGTWEDITLPTRKFLFLINQVKNPKSLFMPWMIFHILKC